MDSKQQLIGEMNSEGLVKIVPYAFQGCRKEGEPPP